MLVVIIVGGLLVVLTTVLHYEVLRGLNAGLPSLGIPSRTKLLFVIISAFFAHAAEIAMYGVAFYTLTRYLGDSTHIGRLGSSLANSLYFSAETYTSLGFGDFTPVGPLRLLTGGEALNGLLLIGWSASFTYISMEKFWTAKALIRGKREVREVVIRSYRESSSPGESTVGPGIAEIDDQPDRQPHEEAQPGDLRQAQHQVETEEPSEGREDRREGGTEGARQVGMRVAQAHHADADQEKGCKGTDIHQLGHIVDGGEAGYHGYQEAAYQDHPHWRSGARVHTGKQRR
jgi:hypothetical protein